MPGSRVPSVEKILQEVYGDIEEYSRSNKSNMDRSKRSSRRRTDSRYRSGLQKDFKFVYYEECRKMLQNIIEHIITEWAYYSRFVGTACARQIWWPWACPPDPYARCMPASSLLSSLRIASLNWPACMRRLHTGRVSVAALQVSVHLYLTSIYSCCSSLLLRGNVFYASPSDRRDFFLLVRLGRLARFSRTQ